MPRYTEIHVLLDICESLSVAECRIIENHYVQLNDEGILDELTELVDDLVKATRRWEVHEPRFDEAIRRAARKDWVTSIAGVSTFDTAVRAVTLAAKALLVHRQLESWELRLAFEPVNQILS